MPAKTLVLAASCCCDVRQLLRYPVSASATAVSTGCLGRALTFRAVWSYSTKLF